MPCRRGPLRRSCAGFHRRQWRCMVKGLVCCQRPHARLSVLFSLASFFSSAHFGSCSFNAHIQQPALHTLTATAASSKQLPPRAEPHSVTLHPFAFLLLQCSVVRMRVCVCHAASTPDTLLPNPGLTLTVSREACSRTMMRRLATSFSACVFGSFGGR